MSHLKVKRQVSKTAIMFPHPVPIGMIDLYMRDSLPFDAAIASVEVKFVNLTSDEYDRLHKACMNERFPNRAKKEGDQYALDLELPKIGMTGGVR